MGDIHIRKDLHQTSTGVGHHYRPGYYFPSSDFKTVLKDPLPSELILGDEVPAEERFQTTAAAAHDVKSGSGNEDPIYKKPPAHWKVNYVKDFHEKLGSGGWRRPLTMGYQTSETHEKFRNEPDTIPVGQFTPNPQGFLLSNHHTNGPSKQILPTTENPKLKGRPFYLRDKAIVNELDPYQTANSRAYRAFTPKELQGYARKDVPTYWECEEYPKAWGHGLQHNPLPKHTVPRKPLPMRDTMVFKSATKINRVPYKNQPVPHSGQRSEYGGNYVPPSDIRSKEANICPVDTPYVLPPPGPKSAFAAPQMYRTEYKNVGSGRPIAM